RRGLGQDPRGRAGRGRGGLCPSLLGRGDSGAAGDRRGDSGHAAGAGNEAAAAYGPLSRRRGARCRAVAVRPGPGRDMSETAARAGAGWTERDTETFIALGRYYVPERDRQIATICAAVPPPAGSARLVELCCGEGLLARALVERFPAATILALDGSEAMLAATA